MKAKIEYLAWMGAEPITTMGLKTAKLSHSYRNGKGSFIVGSYTQDLFMQTSRPTSKLEDLAMFYNMNENNE